MVKSPCLIVKPTIMLNTDGCDNKPDDPWFTKPQPNGAQYHLAIR